jgi:hypothetical protein
MITGISTKEDVLNHFTKWLEREYPIIDEDDELYNRLIIASVDDLINEDGADSDTRIESDNQANMFYVDASADKIGIMTNAPTEALDINSDAIRIRTTQTPASSNNTAVGWGVGTIAWDASYIYVATSSSVIKRVALSTF